MKYVPFNRPQPVRGPRHTAACIAGGLLGAAIAIVGLTLMTDWLW